MELPQSHLVYTWHASEDLTLKELDLTYFCTELKTHDKHLCAVGFHFRCKVTKWHHSECLNVFTSRCTPGLTPRTLDIISALWKPHTLPHNLPQTYPFGAAPDDWADMWEGQWVWLKKNNTMLMKMLCN